jgi:phospholipid transport system substrate-binding protein
MMQFKTYVALLMAGLIAWTSAAWAEAPPDVLARNTTIEVLRIVSQDKDIKGGDKSKIYQLVETKVLPHFDFKEMAQLAVGRNWSKATSDQQQSIIDEFRRLLVRTYAGAISSVSEYKIDFKPLHMRPDDTDVTVSTEVLKPGSPPITIDYRMDKQPEGWKVYDVLVDSVSLVTVYRNSFNSEVRRGGIDGLIAALSRRNQRNAEGDR